MADRQNNFKTRATPEPGSSPEHPLYLRTHKTFQDYQKEVAVMVAIAVIGAFITMVLKHIIKRI